MAKESSLSRRRLLGLDRHPAPGPTVRRRLLFQPETGPVRDVLVCLFLRGGADGLHLVAPCGDAAYYAQRPRLAVARPDDTRAPQEQRGVALDGFFALHPVLAPLQEIYRAGRLTIAHAVGSPDRSHSHFEAMETMERGAVDRSGSATGWLGRHLQTAASTSRSPLRAVAIGDTLPQSLDGALGASAVHSLDEFRLPLPERWSSEFRTSLAGLYGAAEDAVGEAGRETLKLLHALDRIDPARYRPGGGARYPNGEFGEGLRQVAQLMKAQVGLEVACLDLGGWDSHIGQGPMLEGLMRDLGHGLAAFDTDLGERMNRTTVVVMSEFGRRVRENGGLGTDHGSGTCFWLMGGGIAGGRVLADWPGLEEDALDDPGDLRATIDYRDLLAEVVARRLGNPALAQVFPGYTPTFRGVTRA